jgi:hypothetical protein
MRKSLDKKTPIYQSKGISTISCLGALLIHQGGSHQHIKEAKDPSQGGTFHQLQQAHPIGVLFFLHIGNGILFTLFQISCSRLL